MKNVLLLFLALVPASLFSQVSGTVTDKKTAEPISYANIWIENKNIGTTSDTEGRFSIADSTNNKTIIISAIGYEPQRLNAETGRMKIELIPKTYEIGEIVVRPKQKNEIVIDKYNRASISLWFSCEKEPWIVAKPFTYNPAYAQTPYIKKLKILTDSKIEGATFNLRLLSVGENGEPASDILKENLIVTTRKGIRNLIVDLTDYHILFPEEGFFVAVEWLVIDSNKTDFEYKNKKGILIKTVHHEPTLGVVQSKSCTGNWRYTCGKWMKDHYNYSHKKGVPADLAIELTLSD